MAVTFEHIGIPVRNLEESKKFYCDLLGFDEVLYEKEQRIPVYSRIAFLKKDNVRVELLECRGSEWKELPAGRYCGGMHFAMDTDDIEKEYQRWIDAGYRVKIPLNFPDVDVPHEEDWWMCFFYGPNGESVEIRGPKKQ